MRGAPARRRSRCRTEGPGRLVNLGMGAPRFALRSVGEIPPWGSASSVSLPSSPEAKTLIVDASAAIGPASVASYARPRMARSLLDVATSVVPYLALSVLMFWTLHVSDLLPLALAVPTAGFLVRIFIVFHDCAHGSFFRSSRANTWVGRFCGLLVFAPFAAWRHEHAVHHATAGDLDRRGVGDVPTLTVAEYMAMPVSKRIGYRLFRNPLVMFGVGPVWAMVIAPRRISGRARPRLRHSVALTNVALAAVIAGICLLVGWRDFLLVWAPTALV